METAKFLCEFFFDNGWHYLGLMLLVCVMKPNIGARTYNLFKRDEKKED